MLSQILSSSDLFKNLPSEASQLLVKRGEYRHVNAGEKIVNEGDKGEEFFLILRGEFSATKGDQKVASLPQGEVFGEIALFQDTPRKASVTATGESTVFVLNRKGFWNLLAQHIDLALILETMAEERVIELKEQLS